MAIGIRGSASNEASDGGNVTVTLPGGTVEDDVVYGFYCEDERSDIALSVATSGYTELAELYGNDNYDINLAAYRKVQGATPDSTVEFVGSGATRRNTIGGAIVLSGVDTTTPESVTPTTATGNNGPDADPPSITPAHDNSLILIIGANSHGVVKDAAADTAPPAGFTERVDRTKVDVYAASLYAATLAQTTAAAIDPGAWTGTVGDARDSWAAITIAVKEASGGGGGGESVAAAAGSYAVSGQAATTRRSHLLGAVSGSFTVTGYAAPTAAGGGTTDTGWVIAGAGTSDGSFGAAVWGSPGSITADDGSSASALISTTSRYLRSSAHGFAIPTGATIEGIEVRVQGRSSSAGAAFERVRLAKAGTVQSEDRAAGALTGSYADYDFGGAADLWNDTWTAAEINASGFGAAVAVSDGSPNVVEVDAIWIKVHYSEAANRVEAVSGSYAVSGQAAGTLWHRRVVAAQGSYAVTGQAAATRRGHRLAAAQGSYAVSGQAAGTLWHRLLAALQGLYAVTGQAAATRRGHSLAAVQGSYAVSGQAAGLLRGPLLGGVAGLYGVTGQPAGLLRSAITLPAGYGSYRLNGQAATFERGGLWEDAAGAGAAWGDASTPGGIWSDAESGGNSWS